MTAISARPGGGKTSFALQIATQVSKGRRVLYQSLEMPREQLYTCIFARALGLDSALFRDRALTPAQRQRVAQAARLLEEKYSLIIDDRDCAGLQQLEANILPVSYTHLAQFFVASPPARRTVGKGPDPAAGRRKGVPWATAIPGAGRGTRRGADKAPSPPRAEERAYCG